MEKILMKIENQKKRKRDGADAINEKQKRRARKAEEKEEAKDIDQEGGLNIFSKFSKKKTGDHLKKRESFGKSIITCLIL